MRELKKIVKASGSAGDMNPEFMVSWGFFQSLSFLKDSVTPREIDGNLDHVETDPRIPESSESQQLQGTYEEFEDGDDDDNFIHNMDVETVIVTDEIQLPESKMPKTPITTHHHSLNSGKKTIPSFLIDMTITGNTDLFCFMFRCW